MEAKDRIIVALDVDSLDKAKSLVESLAPHVGCFKVGLELLTAVGAPRVIRLIHSLGGQIFYDGKFNDIPNTVARAAKAVADMGVKMFNVHASSGITAMADAVANKGQSLVLAVTVLTSLDARDLWELGYVSSWQAEPWECYHPAVKNHYISNLVESMAQAAKEAGVDGIICSPQELNLLGKREGLRGLLKVTPGIRSSDAPPDDQKRTMTASEAIKAGADYLVIGRPITKAPDPVKAAQKIAEEIASALK